MSIRDHITIFETSPGLFCVRASFGSAVAEVTEVAREDAWEAGLSALCDLMGEAA